MIIDISNLINENVGSITFEGEVIVPDELVKTTEVKELKNVYASGKVIDAGEYGFEISMNIKGTMVLTCAVSLEDVDYDFNIDVNENIEKIEDFEKNNSNLLDITSIIWENIVLEIPLRVVKENAKIKTEGEGWSFLEEEKHTDPRFDKLKELLKEEE